MTDQRLSALRRLIVWRGRDPGLTRWLWSSEPHVSSVSAPRSRDTCPMSRAGLAGLHSLATTQLLLLALLYQPQGDHTFADIKLINYLEKFGIRFEIASHTDEINWEIISSENPLWVESSKLTQLHAKRQGPGIDGMFIEHCSTLTEKRSHISWLSDHLHLNNLQIFEAQGVIIPRACSSGWCIYCPTRLQ